MSSDAPRAAVSIGRVSAGSVPSPTSSEPKAVPLIDFVPDRRKSSLVTPATPSVQQEFSIYFSKYSAKIKRSSRPSSSRADASPIGNRPTTSQSLEAEPIMPSHIVSYSPKCAIITNATLVDPFISDSREAKPRKRRVWEPKPTLAPRRPLSLIGINVEALAKGFEERANEEHQQLVEQQQAQIETLSRRVEEKATALSDAKKKQDKAEEELASAQLETEKLREEQAVLLEEVQDTRDERNLAVQQIEQLDGQIEPLKQKLKDAEDEKRELSGEIVGLRAQLTLRASNGQTLPEVIGTADQLAFANAGWERAKRSAHEYEMRLWQKQEHIERLRKEIAGYEQNLQELESQKAAWQRNLASWNRALEQLARGRDLVEQRAPDTSAYTYHARPPQESQFSVYDCPDDVSREQAITLLLLTAKMALMLSKDSYKAEQKARQALGIADRHPRNPWLLSRCFYWIGRAQLSLGLYRDAAIALEEANGNMSCYPEGRDIHELLKEARKLAASQDDGDKLMDKDMDELSTADTESFLLQSFASASLADDLDTLSRAQRISGPLLLNPPRTLEAEMEERDGSNNNGSGSYASGSDGKHD